MASLIPQVAETHSLFTEEMRPKIHLPKITPKDLLHSASFPVRKDLALVEEKLSRSLSSRVQGVPEMMAYLIRSGGKRVRPLVTCLMAKACSYKGEDHIAIACVAELLHTATLYHDDVVDHASLRRGKPTANSIFGNKIIVLSGDLMLAHCFSLLMNGGHFVISRALSNTVQQMVEGEILELQAEGNINTSIEDYMEIIECKTASLFSWCAQSSAMMAGLDSGAEKEMTQFGHHIGMAFQLVDDFMDFSGAQEQTGKDSFNDLQEGRLTLPLLLALKHEPSLRADVETFFSPFESVAQHEQLRDSLVSRLLEVSQNPAVILELRSFVHFHLERAKALLSSLPHSTYRTALISLLEFLAKREQ